MARELAKEIAAFGDGGFVFARLKRPGQNHELPFRVRVHKSGARHAHPKKECHRSHPFHKSITSHHGVPRTLLSVEHPGLFLLSSSRVSSYCRHPGESRDPGSKAAFENPSHTLDPGFRRG
jgi:hypothetical protein